MTQRQVVIGRRYCAQIALRWLETSIKQDGNRYIETDGTCLSDEEALTYVQSLIDKGYKVYPCGLHEIDKEGRCLGEET